MAHNLPQVSILSTKHSYAPWSRNIFLLNAKQNGLTRQKIKYKMDFYGQQLKSIYLESGFAIKIGH